MSRIVGLVGPEENTSSMERLLDQMVATITLNEGWRSARCATGAAAFAWCGPRQPNVAHDGPIVVVIDGIVFNPDELDCRTGEPIAAAVARLYERVGFEAAMARINGDVAVALYDHRERALWLATDRFGVRPLYYARSADAVAFASQPLALIDLPGVGREPNRQFVGLFAASHYRVFDNDLAASPFARVHRVPAAHALRVTPAGTTASVYWRLADAPDLTEPQDTLAAQYRDLFDDAVAARLRQTTRPAFTLSGGMDSSSVLASAVKQTGERQEAFSVGYVDRTFDESDDIRGDLNATVSRWHPIMVGDPPVFDLVQRMVAAHNEPVATATWLSHFLLCESAARNGNDSLFGGLGGDELNAGEYEHFWYFFADLTARGDHERLAREVEMWVNYHNHPIYVKTPELVRQNLSRLTDLSQPGRCLPDRGRLMRYASVLNRDYFDLEHFEPVMDHPFSSYLKNRTYQDLTRETAPCCLRAEDRHGAAFGLDNLLPFLDYRLVEFMFRVPETMKYRDGVTKNLLREAMRGTLPERTRTRVKKAGWNAPAHTWFSGPGRRVLDDLVNAQRFRERGIYDVREVSRLIDEHDRIVASGATAENHMMFLWQLVNLDAWLTWLDREPAVTG